MDNLFGPVPTWTLHFSPSELREWTKPVNGPDGGGQILLRSLLAALQGDALTLDDLTLQKVYQTAERGSGGFQQRCKVVRSAAWRAGWIQGEP